MYTNVCLTSYEENEQRVTFIVAYTGMTYKKCILHVLIIWVRCRTNSRDNILTMFFTVLYTVSPTCVGLHKAWLTSLLPSLFTPYLLQVRQWLTSCIVVCKSILTMTKIMYTKSSFKAVALFALLNHNLKVNKQQRAEFNFKENYKFFNACKAGTIKGSLLVQPSLNYGI